MRATTHGRRLPRDSRHNWCERKASGATRMRTRYSPNGGIMSPKMQFRDKSVATTPVASRLAESGRQAITYVAKNVISRQKSTRHKSASRPSHSKIRIANIAARNAMRTSTPRTLNRHRSHGATPIRPQTSITIQCGSTTDFPGTMRTSRRLCHRSGCSRMIGGASGADQRSHDKSWPRLSENLVYHEVEPSRERMMKTCVPRRGMVADSARQ
jgi:hypothetical protein